MSDRANLWVAAVVAAVIAGGCAGRDAYQRGLQLAARHNYEAAVSNLAKAARNDPDNENYAQALARTRQQGAAWHVDKARALMLDAQLSAALDHTAAALNLQPMFEPAISIERRIIEQRSIAQTLRDQALALARDAQPEPAVLTMRQSLATDRSQVGGEAMLRDLQAAACNWRLARAQALASQGNLDEAETEAQIALSHQSNNAQAVALLQSIQNRRRAQLLAVQADAQRQAGELWRAMDLYASAHQLDPQMPGLLQNIAEIKQELCTDLLRQAASHQAQGRLVESLQAATHSRRLLPDFGNAPQLIAQLRSALADQHRRQALQAQQAGLEAQGLLHLLAASSHKSDAATQRDQRALLDAIRGKLPSGLAVLVDSAGDVETAAVAPAIERAAISALAGDRQLRLLDRAALARATRTNETTTLRLVPLAIGRLSGADAVDMILTIRIDEASTTASSATRLASATRSRHVMEPNPQYAQAQQQLERARKRLGDARDELAAATRAAEKAREQSPKPPKADKPAQGPPPANPPAATKPIKPVKPTPGQDANGTLARQLQANVRLQQAQKALQEARDEHAQAAAKLAKTPQRVRSERTVTTEYAVNDVTAVSQVRLLLEVLSGATGEALDSMEIEGVAVASDSQVDPSVRKGIAADPLVLPSPQSLHQAAVDDATAKLAAAVRTAMEHRGRQHLQAARNALASQDGPAALEHYVRYLASGATDAKATAEALEQVRLWLGEESALVDVEGRLTALLREQAGR